MQDIRDAVWAVGIEILLTIIALIGAVAVAYLRRAVADFTARTGIEISEANRQRLEQALTNAIAKVEGRVGRATPEDVAQYLLTYNPETLAFFNLEGERLWSRIDAAIALRRAATATTVTPAG